MEELTVLAEDDLDLSKFEHVVRKEEIDEETWHTRKNYESAVNKLHFEQRQLCRGQSVPGPTQPKQ